jgi:hypothetical protein
MPVQAQRRGGGYSSKQFTTLVLEGDGGQHHALPVLPPGNTQYPLYRRLGGPWGQSGQAWKISPLLGFSIWTVQAIASHYTDYYTIPATC